MDTLKSELSITPHSAIFKTTCAESLDKLNAILVGFQLGVVCTSDGLPVASLYAEGRQEHRAAAMAAALSGLSVSIAKEFDKGVLDGTVLECYDGLIFCRQLANTRYPLVLLVIVGEGAVYGHALWAIKNVARELAQALQALA